MWRKLFPELRASEVFVTAIVEPTIIPTDESDLSDDSNLSYLSDKSDLTEDISDVEVSDLSDKSDKSDYHGYMFGLKTNMLFDVLATPSIGIEFPIGSHFSAGANWMYAWWKNHDLNRHWRIYGGDIDARWYFGGGRTDHAPLQGHHIGVYAQVLLFQIAFGGNGYITGIPGENILGKPWWCGGIEYGYSKRIGRRFNIDFSLGMGYATGEYNVYKPIDECYVWQSTHHKRWFGLTKAEISLVWLIGKIPNHVESLGSWVLKKGGGE